MENQSYVESVKRTSIVQSFFAQVYGWMFFGLLTTGIVAYYTANSPALLNLIFGSKITFYAFLFAPIVLVMIISGKINSLSANMASFLFFVYSAVTGVTLSAIFLVYTQDSIATTFGITAGTFGATALFGSVPSRYKKEALQTFFHIKISSILPRLLSAFLLYPPAYLGLFC